MIFSRTFAKTQRLRIQLLTKHHFCSQCEELWSQRFLLGSAMKGLLSVNSYRINVSITPSLLATSNESNQACVRLMGPLNTAAPDALDDLVQVEVVNEHSNNGALNVHINHNSHLHEILPENCLLDIKVPHKFDIDYKGKLSTLRINKMESDSLNVYQSSGTCEFLNVKALNANIRGDSLQVVFSQPFLANLDLHLQKGSVVAKRIQGQTVDIKTLNGDINIQALYADMANLFTQRGDIHVRNCHGQTHVNTDKGNIGINSLDGNLTASVKQGNIYVHLTSHQEVDLAANDGKVSISVPEDCSTQVQFHTERLHDVNSIVRNCVKKENITEGHIGILSDKFIKATGTCIDLRTMNWITAQKKLS